MRDLGGVTTLFSAFTVPPAFMLGGLALILLPIGAAMFVGGLIWMASEARKDCLRVDEILARVGSRVDESPPEHQAYIWTGIE